MIKLFRNIRKKLASENKAMAYSRYAMGEIVLVVIGILIALQINNWNSERILKKEELNILKDLKVEITDNISSLYSVITQHEKSYNAALKIDSLFDNRQAFEKVQDSVFSNLGSTMDWNQTFDPKNGILKSIISSGQISYLSNKELKYKLASIEDEIIDAFEDTYKIEEWRNNLTTTLYTKGYIIKDSKIDGFDIRKYYDDPQFRMYTKVLFINIRSQGLKEERQLKKNMISILDLINEEILKAQ